MDINESTGNRQGNIARLGNKHNNIARLGNKQDNTSRHSLQCVVNHSWGDAKEY